MILGSEPLILRRFPPVAWGSDGRITIGAPTETTIRGSFQPLNGQEIAILSEGERQTDQRKLYTKTELRTADPRAGTLADRVVVDGITWEVHQVEHERTILPHYKARLLRFQEIAEGGEPGGGPGLGGAPVPKPRIEQPLFGVIDGVNTVFLTAEPFLHDEHLTIALYFNGQRMMGRLNNDFWLGESAGPGSGYDTVTLAVAPRPGDNLTADYYVV